jgi:hypothetical protein
MPGMQLCVDQAEQLIGKELISSRFLGSPGPIGNADDGDPAGLEFEKQGPYRICRTSMI